MLLNNLTQISKLLQSDFKNAKSEKVLTSNSVVTAINALSNFYYQTKVKPKPTLEQFETRIKAPS